MSLILNFPTSLRNLQSFAKTHKYYLFGCEKGILITNHSFEKHNVLKDDSVAEKKVEVVTN